MALGTDLCMRVEDNLKLNPKDVKMVYMVPCNSSDIYQQWSFEEYKERYDMLANTTTTSEEQLNHLNPTPFEEDLLQ